MSTDPVYFWREYEEPFGVFSQWYESSFAVDGVTYETAEMWMMIEKARLFGDEEIAQQMMKTTVPAEHQSLGRKAKGFNRAKWDSHKSEVVEKGNYHKFTKSEKSEEYIKLLLGTADRELVEASPHDSIWGVGFDATNATANRAKWGENLLGKALMKVRDQLRKEGYKG